MSAKSSEQSNRMAFINQPGYGFTEVPENINEVLSSPSENFSHHYGSKNTNTKLTEFYQNGDYQNQYNNQYYYQNIFNEPQSYSSYLKTNHTGIFFDTHNNRASIDKTYVDNYQYNGEYILAQNSQYQNVQNNEGSSHCEYPKNHRLGNSGSSFSSGGTCSNSSSESRIFSSTNGSSLSSNSTISLDALISQNYIENFDNRETFSNPIAPVNESYLNYYQENNNYNIF